MKLPLIILLCLASGHLFGTAQIPDFLIYQNDTLAIYSNPLESYLEKKGDRTIGEISMRYSCTSVWRGYVATWKLENDSLFLVKIEINNCDKKPIALDMSKEFGIDKVFADWVSSELLNPYGRQLWYVHQDYQSIHEFERGFIFLAGKLKRINDYDNSRSRKSEFSSNSQILQDFLYNKINWKLVDDQLLESRKVVIVTFQTDAKGSPIKLKIRRGYSSELDKEALRVAKLIPEWSVFFRKGKVIETDWVVPIYFDK